MITVEADAAAVETRLIGGQLSCPECDGVLSPWGWARARVLRGVAGEPVLLRPRRALCSDCGVSHVLLPVFVLLRRADVVEVIGSALMASSRGAGVRTIAVGLGRPVETVRGWVRRLVGRAEVLRAVFTVLLVDVGVDPVPPGVSGSPVADAVAAVLAAWAGLVSRWPFVGKVSPWRAAVAVSGGRLLAPGWPPLSINTSCL